MIPKVFLLAFLFLSLQSSSSSNAQSANEGDAAFLEGTARVDVLNEPTTTFHAAASAIGSKKTVSGIEDLNSPKVQFIGDDSQIPIQISTGKDEDAVIQRGAREINFNNVPPGFYDPTKVSFPDGFQILAQPHTYNLKDAFPLIPPPPGISRVWGLFPAGGRFEGYFSNAGGTATNVSIEFGWIENGALTAGSYRTEIWTLRFQGWDIVTGPSGSFNGSDWETTTNIVASGDRFIFDFSGGPSDKVLAVSRVFYDLP